MNKYESVNINLKELEKDYWEWVLNNYTNTKDYTKKTYVLNPYTNTFMKTYTWLKEYKTNMTKTIWRYGQYSMLIAEYTREDNSIDIHYFAEQMWLWRTAWYKLIAKYIEVNLIRQQWRTYYVNPLVIHYGRDIPIDVAILFKDELKKVWIKIQ